ncbi:MAG: calcium-activated chloride channel-domain-containing protein [Linnemannia elongata]|nr:MAG: calcium-activated chloride channel-domain-containing protein [Linnemannia elongata]
MTSPNSGHHPQEHQSSSSPSPSPAPSDITDTNHSVIRHQLVDNNNPIPSNHPHPNATPYTSPQQFLSPLRIHNTLRRDVLNHNIDSRTIDRASTVSERSRSRHKHPNRASSASMPQLLAEARTDDFTRSPNHGRQIVTRSDSNSQAESSIRERKRRVDRLQLSPRPHGHITRNVESPTPSVTPLSPNSIRSGKSRHSSTRRTTRETTEAQTAAAVELADQQNLRVITRNMSSYRVVQLLYQTDADLFDAIQDWKERHPDLWVDDAIDAFASARGSDALAQLVYSTEAFDLVLKYSASHEDLGPLFDNHNRRSQSLRSPSIAARSFFTNNQQSPGGDGSFRSPSPLGSPYQPSQAGQTTTNSTGSPSVKGRPSTISRIRHSPAKLFTRPQSPSSSINYSANSPATPRDVTGNLPNSSTTYLNSPSMFLQQPQQDGVPVSPPRYPFQPLEPLDCSTDLFPSVQSSTVIGNSAQTSGMSYVSDVNTPHQYDPYPPPLLPPPASSFSIPFHDEQRPSPLMYGQEEQHQQQQIATERNRGIRRRKSQRPSKAKMREWKIQLHRRDFQLAMLKEGLFLELEKSIDSDAVYVKVLAPFWRLAEEAQTTNCKAELADPFCCSCLRLFLFATKNMVNSIMMRTESRNHPYGRKMGLRSALRRGAYQKLFALHDGPFKSQSKSTNEANYRAQLRVKWARRFWRSQPLDLVNAYYGERIGVYFAWLGHYTKWLTLPAVVGMAVFVFGIINAARLNKLDATPNALFAIFDNVLTMPFALFMSMWSTVYIEFWKRANQYYAFRWNMIDYERVELPRTEFRATRVRFSPVTGKRELYYPVYWKALRLFASSVAVIIAVLVVIGSVACLMIFKSWCRHHLGGPYATIVATALLNLIIIIILGEIWCRLAEWLTDKENHKYTDAYEDSLIIKRYLFDFANMYATLFYYAFFKAPDSWSHFLIVLFISFRIESNRTFQFGGKVLHRPDLRDTCLYDSCITELSVQLAVVFIGKQFLNGFFEMAFPWIKKTWNRKKILAEQALKRLEFLKARKQNRTPQWVKDDELPSYDGRILKCYRKTVIQFGFCTLFVTSFPVAPAFALINNWIDLRMEAYRLLTQYRRPIAYRAQDIGMWEKIMEFVSFTSVITNAAIIAFSSLWIKQNLFIKYLHATKEEELLAAQLGFILVFEHVVFLFKIILRAAIPNVPLTIKLAVQRSKYMSRVANEGLDSEMDEDYDDDDMDSLSQSDETDTQSSDDDDDDETASRTGSSLWRAQTHLGTRSNTHGDGGEVDSGQADTARAKNSRPGLDMARSWSSRVLQFRGSSSKRNKSKRKDKKEIKDAGLRGKDSAATLSAAMAGALPKIQEIPPSIRSGSVTGTNGSGTGPGAERWRRPEDFNEKVPDGYEVGIMPLHQQEMIQYQLPLAQSPVVGVERPLRPSQSLGSQRRPPIPQRANTEMDGEWVVLEEKGM